MPGDFDQNDNDFYDDQDDELEDQDELVDGDDDSADDEEGEPARPANRWSARRSLSDHLEDEDGEDSDEAQDPTATGDRPTKPAAQGEEPGARDRTQEQKAQESEAPVTTPRYTRLDAEGKPVTDPLLAKGQAIQFKGDGKIIRVASDDELIQLAQKGAAFDRKTSEQGTRIQELETRVDEVAQEADQVLLRVLFGYTKEDGTKVTPREVREQLRPQLKRFLDPDYVQGQEALRREQARVEAAKQEQSAELEHKRTEFWTHVGEEIGGQLEQHPHLTEDDAEEITSRFYAGYTRAFERAIAGGQSEDEAQRAAFSALSKANLHRVMRGLNAERAEDGQPAARPAAKRQTPADADRHNTRVSRKVDSRRTAPRLQGNPGTPPAGRAPSPADREKDRPLRPGETVFQRRMSSMRRTLRNAGRDEGESGDDD